MKLFPRRAWFYRLVTGLSCRSFRLGGMLSVLLVLLLATRATAAVHPVPLDKNTDPKKCLECHDDKAKHKFVHSAMQAGCLSCHEIRVNKDVTRVKLITATTTARCALVQATRRKTFASAVTRRGCMYQAREAATPLSIWGATRAT
jgi:hypothetical protein